MCAQRPLVQVGVFDHQGKYVESARVGVEPKEAGGTAHSLQWDRSRGCYVALGVGPGPYCLTAQAPGHDDAKRDVEVEAEGLRTIVILGAAGLSHLYRGRVKTPFQPQPDLFAIALDESMSADAVAKLDNAADEEGLRNEFVDSNWQAPRHGRVLRFPAAASEASRAEMVQKLVAFGGVRRLGPLVHFDKNESISCLTDELVVRMRPGGTRADVEALAGRRNLTMLRQLVVAENVFVFRMPGPVSYEMLGAANEIATKEPVVYAEPNLISIGIRDSIAGGVHPTDFLFPMQWHLPLMRCPQAWQLIRDSISPHRAMGSSEITIAVVDWGIDIANPEFAGNLANGQPKVSAVFDFHNMAASNDGRSHGHGTCCAGVATALPNNDGGCGVAGNCRLMAIRRPEGIMASETAYSDMYLWIAGLDPKSPTPGFPAPIAPGADVISNSFGYAAGLPISGLMQDTFDLVTKRGRGGHGVLLFFSTGNTYPPVDFTLLRPWAADPRTFAVSGSTLAINGATETRAKESNFGGVALLDLCAPSATALGSPHDPPTSHAVITAADRVANDPDPNLRPNAPGEATARTITTAAAAVGATSLSVASSSLFNKDDFIVIGTPGAGPAEFNQITRILGGTTLELKDTIKSPHASGAAISTGPRDSLHTFSGASCATALAAGVGALLLSACPELGWKQARELLRRTAAKIDPVNSDATGIWRDAKGVLFGNRGYAGPHYSRGYGFGRIDAAAAVEAALARRSV